MADGGALTDALLVRMPDIRPVNSLASAYRKPKPTY